MAFVYKPLWKKLIDEDMSKKNLMEVTGISKSTIDRMSRNEFVSLEVIDRVCNYFDCDVSDVMEHVSLEKGKN